MTEQPLDNFYHLDDNHDQVAYNNLVQLPEVQEELLWTALPKSKKTAKDLFGALVLTPSAMTLYIWFSADKLSWSIAGLIYTLVAFFGVISLLNEEQLRRKNFYGMSATTLWVKKHKEPLQQYHIPHLTRLVLNNGVISYSTIQNNEYNKYTLLEDIPNIETVYQLLLELQQR